MFLVPRAQMARMVATKAALSIRLDALADADSKSSLDSATIGLESRAKLETRLRLLEQGIGHTSLRSIGKAHDAKAGGQKKFEMQGNGAAYNDAADTLVPTGVKGEEEEEEKKVRKEKKEKKRKGEEEEGEVSMVVDGEEDVRSLSLSCGDDADAFFPRAQEEAAKKAKKAAKKEAKRLAALAAEGGAAEEEELVSPKKEKKEKKSKRKAEDDDEGAVKKARS